MKQVLGFSEETGWVTVLPALIIWPSMARKLVRPFSILSACWLGFSRSNKLQPGVCGSVVTPRKMNLPSTSLPGFTLSTDANHKDKQDVGFSLSYRC